MSVPTSAYVQSNDPQERNRPWKYDGYPRFAAWQASDRDVAIYRRFGALSTRCALYLQDQLVQLEEDIEHLDDVCKKFPNHGRNDSFRFDRQQHLSPNLDPHAKRHLLMESAIVLTKQLHDYLDSWGKIRALPIADPKQTQHIKNWFYNHPEAVERKERAFIEKEGDLIAVATERRPPIERWLLRRGLWFKKLFKEKRIPFLHVESSTTTYTDDRLVQAFANAIVAIIGLLFLVIPALVLTYMATHVYTYMAKTGVICAAVVLESIILAVVTDQKAFQILLATAAYAAVLLIYLQIGSTSGSGVESNAVEAAISGMSDIVTTRSRIQIATVF